ncbi:MAG: hypothetical protein QXS78_02035 [Candidatus Micrarchaeaceae archaeon]
MVEKTIETEETKALKNEIKNFKTLARLHNAMAGVAAAVGGLSGIAALGNLLSSDASNQNAALIFGVVSSLSFFYAIYSLLRGSANGQKAETLWDELKTKLRKN